jgi:hypothetical protein
VADVLSALVALGPHTPTRAVVEYTHWGLDTVRATLHDLEGAGAVALDLEAGTPGPGRPPTDTAVVLRDALAAVQNTRLLLADALTALTRAERAVKRALEKTQAP